MSFPSAVRSFRSWRRPRERGGTLGERDVDLTTPRHGERVADVTVTPLPGPDGTTLVTLQERGFAHRLDRQLLHRGAVRSLHGMAAVLAHEIKNPLAGIRGAAQLIEDVSARSGKGADAAHLPGIRSHQRADRSHGSLRRHARAAACAGEHPRSARSRAQSGVHELRARREFRRSLRSVAAAGARRSRPAHSGVHESGAQCERRAAGSGRRNHADDGLSARRESVGRRHGFALQPAARNHRARQRLGRSHRSRAAHFRSVRHDQGARLGTGPGAGRQDRRRPWRGHRMRIRAAAHGLPRFCCRKRAKEADHAGWNDPHCRRRCGHPHGPQPGAGPRGLRRAHDGNGGGALALGGRRRRQSRHHRCRAARRKRLRSHSAHQAHTARAARRGDERAEHDSDGDHGGRARRVRISAEAVRPEGTDVGRAARAAEPASRSPNRHSVATAAKSVCR